MKRADMYPRLAVNELRQAVQAVRQFAGQPAEDEEGYDPHVEHRDYERLKEEMRKTKAELEKIKAHERELTDALAEAEKRPAPRREERDSISWKRAIVLSEILGPPRSRRK
ncbi:MAG: hypothetical protein IKA58_06955 [Clostridia bacterium]|nr:hypothetical protein [Clostridia bacterium]MBR6653477.1 hypothetical protein [Oscillospiraceae bacterium]